MHVKPRRSRLSKRANETNQWNENNIVEPAKPNKSKQSKQTSWQANKSSVAKSSKAWQTASSPGDVKQTSWPKYQVRPSISKQSRPDRTGKAKQVSKQIKKVTEQVFVLPWHSLS